jgi:hypothetical protein
VGARSWLADVVAWAVGLPVAVGFTALGAGVLLVRGFGGALARVLPTGPARSGPRHHVGRVRAQVEAARRAARHAGVLGRPARRGAE